MIFVPPIPIYDANLISSSVPEPDTGETAWVANEIAALGDERYIGTIAADVTISNGTPCVVTWPSAHNLAVDKPFSFSTTNTLPAPLVVGQIYFILEIRGTTQFTFSDSIGGAAIFTTSAGAGVHHCTVEIHAIYEAEAGARGSATVTVANPGVVNWAGHGRVADEAIVFTVTGGTAPTGITAGQTVYVKTVTDVDHFTFANTIGGAAVNVTAAGTGALTCGTAATYNKPPLTNDTLWLYSRPTNRYALFDSDLSSKTTAAGSLTVVIAPGRFDSFGALEVDGATLDLSYSIPGTGVVYDYSIDLQNGVTVGDWFEYYYKPIYQQNTVALPEVLDAAIQALPMASDGQLTITLSRPGGTVSIAAALVGIAVDLGGTLRKARVRIIDDSQIDDTKGKRVLEKGGYRKIMQVQTRVDVGQEDNIARQLSAYRSTPILFIGHEDFGALCMLGFYDDWDLEIDPPVDSVLDLQAQSLSLT